MDKSEDSSLLLVSWLPAGFPVEMSLSCAIDVFVFPAVVSFLFGCSQQRLLSTNRCLLLVVLLG